MSYVRQGRLLAFEDFFVEGDDNHRLVMVLDALGDDALIGKLESERKCRQLPIVLGDVIPRDDCVLRPVSGLPLCLGGAKGTCRRADPRLTASSRRLRLP